MESCNDSCEEVRNTCTYIPFLAEKVFRRKLGLVLKKVSLKVNLKLYELFLT